MDEPRDDFLAGAGLAGEQHGRVGRRDLRRLLQHVAPFRGFADDADLSPGFELLGEQLHPRFEPLGAGLRLGGLSCRFDELLVRDRERDVIRDPARQPADRRGANAPACFDQKARSITCSRAGTLTLKNERYPAAMTGANASGGFKDRQWRGGDVGDDELSGRGVLCVTDGGSGKSSGAWAWRTK